MKKKKINYWKISTIICIFFLVAFLVFNIIYNYPVDINGFKISKPELKNVVDNFPYDSFYLCKTANPENCLYIRRGG